MISLTVCSEDIVCLLNSYQCQRFRILYVNWPKLCNTVIAFFGVCYLVEYFCYKQGFKMQFRLQFMVSWFAHSKAYGIVWLDFDDMVVKQFFLFMKIGV